MTDIDITAKIDFVLRAEAEALEDLRKNLDMAKAAQVVREIAAARECGGRVVTTGCGTSGAAAKKIAHTLSCIEIPSLFLTPSDAVHGSLGAVQPGDAVILVSKGGNTAELLKLLAPLRAKGAFLIGVSEDPASQIAADCDLFLLIRVEREPDSYNMLATASTISVIGVFDAIAIALMQYTGYTREQFAVIHPGGAVGERLTKGAD